MLLICLYRFDSPTEAKLAAPHVKNVSSNVKLLELRSIIQ